MTVLAREGQDSTLCKLTIACYFKICQTKKLNSRTRISKATPDMVFSLWRVFSQAQQNIRSLSPRPSRSSDLAFEGEGLTSNERPQVLRCQIHIQVLSWARNGQKVCFAALAALFLGTATLLGRSYAIYSPPLCLTFVAATAVAVTLYRLRTLEARLTFTDWNQTDNA